MANTLYDSAREKFLTGQINWLEQTIKILLVYSSGYNVEPATHTSLASIPPEARVTPSGITLTNKTATAGAADGADVTFTAVTGGSIKAIVGYVDGDSEADSPLLFYIDTATGLPITPNGGDIIVTWDNGANRIFKL